MKSSINAFYNDNQITIVYIILFQTVKNCWYRLILTALLSEMEIINNVFYLD